MKSPLRVVIVDDETTRSEGWAKSINSLGIEDIAVEALSLESAQKIIESADLRRRQAREGIDPFLSSVSCELDNVDVLVVDYDLQELVKVGQWSTGAQVTTLARAFTQAKLIVLVNQFGTNSFDLTLKKASLSHSDFDIGSGQILNPAFWDRARVDGYSPWAWNEGVIGAVARMTAAIEWVGNNLDRPVLEALGFTFGIEDGEKSNYLSYELWQGVLERPEQTFRELVLKSEFLSEKDRKDVGGFDSLCSRVAAAVVSHWLERTVIPACESLIDLPHLVSAYPWLLINPEEEVCWNATTQSSSQIMGSVLPDLGLCLYESGFPLARPVFWKQKLSEHPELSEPAGFSYDNFPDMVFCEDTSCFHEFSQTRPFQSHLPGGDPQRYVANQEYISSPSWKHPLSDVSYEPSVLFAL